MFVFFAMALLIGAALIYSDWRQVMKTQLDEDRIQDAVALLQISNEVADQVTEHWQVDVENSGAILRFAYLEDGVEEWFFEFTKMSGVHFVDGYMAALRPASLPLVVEENEVTSEDASFSDCEIEPVNQVEYFDDEVDYV